MRHLGAVGVAVEDREEADDDGGDHQRRAQRQHHRDADDQRRGGDADLDAGDRHAGDAERAAERHHQREGDRQQPDRRRAEEGAPEADGDHGRDMVPAEDRVQEAGDEAAAGRLAGVGGGGGGEEGDGGSEGQGSAQGNGPRAWGQSAGGIMHVMRAPQQAFCLTRQRGAAAVVWLHPGGTRP